MNAGEVFSFVNRERLGVLATARGRKSGSGFDGIRGDTGIGDSVRHGEELAEICDLEKNPAVAWVIGSTTEVTVQYEGVAEELEGEELAKYKKTYFAAFPDGPARESWPGITYLWCARSGCAIAITIRESGGSRRWSFRRWGALWQIRVRARRRKRAERRREWRAAGHPERPSPEQRERP